jgi:uncharacterized small protein (DUF1192 family)
MRRMEAAATGGGGTVAEREAWRPLSKQEIDERIEMIREEIAQTFAKVEPERIEFLGEAIEAMPIDTRLFIRVMGRYISFN